MAAFCAIALYSCKPDDPENTDPDPEIVVPTPNPGDPGDSGDAGDPMPDVLKNQFYCVDKLYEIGRVTLTNGCFSKDGMRFHLYDKTTGDRIAYVDIAGSHLDSAYDLSQDEVLEDSQRTFYYQMFLGPENIKVTGSSPAESGTLCVTKKNEKKYLIEMNCVVAEKGKMALNYLGEVDLVNDSGASRENTITINGQSLNILSAGYFYEPDCDGYDLVFSTAELNLSRKLKYVPSDAFTVSLDIPKSSMGSAHYGPLAEGALSSDDWACYVAYSTGTEKYSEYVLNSGDFIFALHQNNYLDVEFKIVSGSDVIQVRYVGFPSVSEDDYIW